MVKDEMDPVMVDRVKGLGCVKKEKKTVDLLFYSLVEKLIDVQNVIITIFPGKKTFLGRVNKVANRRHDRLGN